MCFLSSAARIDGEHSGELYREVDNGTHVQDVFLALLVSATAVLSACGSSEAESFVDTGLDTEFTRVINVEGVTDCDGALH